MSTQVVVTLPDDVYRRVERLAHLASRDVADVVADTLALSLLPVGLPSEPVRVITELPDAELLELVELEMPPAQDQTFSRLLQKQQEGRLSDQERSELVSLMQLYQEGLLRKAQALREAVRRGLREPLEP
jgi:hypothetical protein